MLERFSASKQLELLERLKRLEQAPLVERLELLEQASLTCVQSDSGPQPADQTENSLRQSQTILRDLKPYSLRIERFERLERSAAVEHVKRGIASCLTPCFSLPKSRF